MKFINFAVVKFSVCLTLGILTAHFFPFPSVSFLEIILPIIILLGLFWWFTRNALQPTVFFGIITYICFFALGYFNYQERLPSHNPNHYSNILLENEDPEILQLKISEILKPDTYNQKYLATVKAVNKISSEGILLLSIVKDSLFEDLKIDQVLVVSAKPIPINKPQNPGQFDYSKYMKTLGVYDQIRIANDEIILNTNGSSTLRGKAEQTRNFLLNKLEKTKLSLDERAIIQALVLGQRRDISKELYQSYAAAGAIHILAVSGLHVGILYIILLFLLKPLHYIRYGKTVQIILVLLFLWCFAFVTGLSPSVTRAVTMFSLFAFAGLLKRRTSSINTLFLSFFILLLVNPLWLFHVGFQLSYLAVFFILWVQPKLYRYYVPKNKVTKLLWSIFTVTIAAQLGIIPLSLFYFHQFPGLFFITNLVVLPVLSILLGGGLLVILLAVLNILPDFIVLPYNWMVAQLNAFIKWVAAQDAFLFTDIPFSEGKVVGSYLLIITIILFWKKGNFKTAALSLASIILLLGIFVWDKKETATHELVIFQKSRQTLIGYKNNATLLVFSNDTIFKYQYTYPLKSYKTAKNIKTISKEKIPAIFNYRSKKLIVLDSLGIYPKNVKPEWLLLTYSPKVNLQRILDSLQPLQVIADGSNYKSYVYRWQATCIKNKIPFHYTGEKGAIVLK